jgi:hypothetical protein
LKTISQRWWSLAATVLELFSVEGVTVTMNSKRYAAMLQNFLQSRMENIVENEALEDMWFKQDGATAHTVRMSLNVLKRMFPGCLVSLMDDLQWPARSPDLSIWDFFLWGHLKERVFRSCPHTLPQPREQIIAEVMAIPRHVSTCCRKLPRMTPTVC